MSSALFSGFPTIVPSSVFGKNAPGEKINIGQIGFGRIAFTHDLPLTMEYDIARAFILARTKYKLTQKQLALKLKTKQSVVSRVENAQTTASLSFLKRFASIFGGNVMIHFNLGK